MLEENNKISGTGMVYLRDLETKELSFLGSNHLHTGNMIYLFASMLAGTAQSQITKVYFGNGATEITTSGSVMYKPPRVQNSYDLNTTLYNRTYTKTLSSGDVNVNYHSDPDQAFVDVEVTILLDYNEPSDQDLLDYSTSYDNNSYVFDELGLVVTTGNNEDILITHKLTHPIKKARNRAFEIFYVLRLSM